MAKKPTKKPAAKAAAATGTDTGIQTVSVSRKFTINSGDFEGYAVQATVTASDHETASSHLDEVIAAEAEKANVQFAEIIGSANRVIADLEADDEEAELEDDEEEEADDEEEEAIGPEDVAAMKRTELIELVKENELDLDPDDYKGTGGLAKFRAAVTEAAFGEDDEDEELEDDEDEELEDDEEDAEDEDEELTEASLADMNRKQLLEVAEEHGLEVDEDDYPKSKKGTNSLRDDLIATLFEDEDDDEEDADDDEEEADEEEEGYTEAELKDMSPADLKAIYKDWDLGKYPSGAPKKAKSAAIKRIMKEQNEA